MNECLKNKHSSEMIGIIISACFVYASLIFNIKAMYYFGALVSLCLFVIVPAKKLLNILIFMMPLENMFRGSMNLQLISIGLIILLVKLLFDERYKMTIQVIAINLSIIISVLISSVFFQKLVDLDVLRIAINFFIVSAYYSIYEEQSRDYSHSYINYLVLGCLALGAFSVLEVLLKKGLYSLFIRRMYGIKEDPNYIASYFAISISLLVCRLYNQQNKSGIKYIPLIIAFIFMGLLTQSRGFLIAMLPNLLFLLLLMLKLRNCTRQKISIIICIILFSIIVVWQKSYFLTLMHSISSRVSVAYETGGTGRVDIWKNILDVLLSDLKLFLLGAPNELNAAAHNIFLDILANYGFIMLILILLLYYFTFDLFIEYKESCITRKNMIALLPMLTMSISYFFLSALLLNMFFYTFVLVAMMFNFKTEDVQNDRGRFKSVAEDDG